MPNYFSRIDETTIVDHPRLDATDEVYYLYEYTSGQNYSYGATNNLISNLKKKPSRRNLPEYRYKLQDIRRCAQDLAAAVNHKWLASATLVPVPPSKARDHPEYDNRMAQICGTIPVPFPVDVREMIIQAQSMDAAHECQVRPTVEELLEAYQWVEELTSPVPRRIAIVDDVLTAGTHFRALHMMLAGRYLGVPIVGMFIARRIFPQTNPFEDFDFTQL